MKKKLLNVFSTVLCGVMAFTTFASCVDNNGDSSGAGNKDEKVAITIMTEELSGTFNPFYATSGTDMDVVGMTQIGMLSTDKNGNTVAGDEYPTVVKAFEVNDSNPAETVYTFVIKNGLKFSDGKPLTMNDVLFNMYEYLDPVYTGSSTMYSIDIKGLAQYRLQANYSGGNDAASEQMALTADSYAAARIQVLIDLYEMFGETGTSTYYLTEAEMRDAIAQCPETMFEGYKYAVATPAEQEKLTVADYQAMLLADYELTLKTFKEELQADFKAAKESFDLTTVPYAEHAAKLQNDVFKFFLYERYITPEYAIDPNTRKPDKTKIEKFNGEELVTADMTEEAAINKVYNDSIQSNFNDVLSGWGTAGTLRTRYAADALSVLLRKDIDPTKELPYAKIEGIVSLGHNTETTEVKVGDTLYTVAQEHNEDGTPKNAGEYDVLQITINGQDPKAIYNFGFTVAPAHYYSADEEYPNGRPIDIENNQFGVPWSDSNFQQKTIQSLQHLEIPVGAGPYKATNLNNSDTPKGTEFWRSNVVYFKANHHFEFPVKTEKIRMQVVSSTNALDKLANGEIDYVTPQFTKANSDRLKELASKGFVQLSSTQLGYGYIGVNAGKITNRYVRKAIMAAMQTGLATQYYEAGTCTPIAWPMSTVSWAYPWEDPNATNRVEKDVPDSLDYLQWTGVEDAKTKIENYMREAQKIGNANYEITFTIAGASITEHPTYLVFKQASEILNSVGWNVEVVADSQALTKLSTGALEVWAAAWGSTIDPDMYQVYHKNSTATSVLAWGYREIKNSPNSWEYSRISDLSVLIDQARETMVREDTTKENGDVVQGRISLYEDAMEIVLDLAVEMPVYQRDTLYAYNSNTIKGLNHDVNPYSTPLEKIWEVELVK